MHGPAFIVASSDDARTYWKPRNKIEPRKAAVNRCSHLSSPNDGLLNTYQANLANRCVKMGIDGSHEFRNDRTRAKHLTVSQFLHRNNNKQQQMTHHFTALSQESSTVDAIPWMNRQAGPIRDSRGGSGAQGDHRDPTTSYS